MRPTASAPNLIRPLAALRRTPSCTKVWMAPGKGATTKGWWQESSRSPGYLLAPATSYSLTPWKVAGSLSRPASAASLPHERAVGLAPRPASAGPATLNLFGFTAPVVKSERPKPPPRPPPPSRDSVLRKQVWAKMAAIEDILVQWISSERMAVRSPRPRPSRSAGAAGANGPQQATDDDDPASAAAAEAALEAAELQRCVEARDAASAAVLVAQEGLPPAGQARKEAAAAFQASLEEATKKFKPKKGGPTEPEAAPEVVEALAQAEAALVAARAAIEAARAEEARATMALETAQRESADKARSLALIKYDKQLRAVHEDVTQRVRVALPYCLSLPRHHTALVPTPSPLPAASCCFLLLPAASCCFLLLPAASCCF
jgi:hypothetical protein